MSWLTSMSASVYWFRSLHFSPANQIQLTVRVKFGTSTEGPLNSDFLRTMKFLVVVGTHPTNGIYIADLTFFTSSVIRLLLVLPVEATQKNDTGQERIGHSKMNRQHSSSFNSSHYPSTPLSLSLSLLLLSQSPAFTSFIFERSALSISNVTSRIRSVRAALRRFEERTQCRRLTFYNYMA